MGQTEEHKINHIFIMTGADPNTNWLDGCITLDSKGFIKTGPDLSRVLRSGLLHANRIYSKRVYLVFSL
jgi:thioredoxin reductase